MLLNKCILLNFIKYNLSIVLSIIMSNSVCLLRRFLICQNYSIPYTFLSKCFKVLAFLFWSMSCFRYYSCCVYMVEVHLLQFGYPVIMITFTEKKFSLNCFNLFVRIFDLKVLCGNLCCWSSLPSTIHFLDYWSIVAWLKAIKIVLRFCTFFKFAPF